MSFTDPTFIGQIASVTGSIVRVRLREDTASTLIMISGHSYRIGQVGGFFRIPLGYTNLYAVCTQVGADAAPLSNLERGLGESLETDIHTDLSGYRWITVILFGEGIGNSFERGVGQYPTIGDEVHLVTNDDLKVIYGWAKGKRGTISIGQIAATSGISADINIAGLVSRHSAIVGSTGAGKSNLVTVMMESISSGDFPNSRTIIIDPHGEYASALRDRSKIFSVNPDESAGEKHLWVPFWALSFSDIQQLTLGGIQPGTETAIRDLILDMKIPASKELTYPPLEEMLTADSPIPFSIRQLWYDLDSFERITFDKDKNSYTPEDKGDPLALKSAKYPKPDPYNKPPYKNQQKRGIERQLDFMRSRLRDGRFSFLFSPGDGYNPDLDGKVEADLDTLVKDWVGHDKPITIIDVSGLPSEVLSIVVGTMLQIIYDMLFWAQDMPIGGRQQPLLVALDEAHRFIPEGSDTPAHKTLSMIAKEGRKYGVGLMLITQRPSEIDSAILSQCGSLMALRTTSSADRSKVMAAVSDDLGGLIDQLPSLRTGEGIFLGEMMPIPSRVRVRMAKEKTVGSDPNLPEAWYTNRCLEDALYSQALLKWRTQSTSTQIQEDKRKGGDPNDA